MHDAAQDPDELAWPAIGVWPTLTAAYDHALVVLAMNLDCRVDGDGEGSYAVRADPAHEAAIRREFEHYAEEESQKRVRAEVPVFPAGVELALVWVAVLVAVFLKQTADPALTGRFSNSSEALVMQGEWWRPFTALFFHGDFGHLMGNVLIGGLFCLLAAQSVGAWRAWILILMGGTLGNALNAWLHYPEAFSSIGASTATFAAVGVLVGAGMVRAWATRSYNVMRPILVPVFVGLITLGWFGSGGENTDVAGHVAGLACGTVLGVFAGYRKVR